jgi:hypothetical protein
MDDEARRGSSSAVDIDWGMLAECCPVLHELRGGGSLLSVRAAALQQRLRLRPVAEQRLQQALARRQQQQEQAPCSLEEWSTLAEAVLAGAPSQLGEPTPPQAAADGHCQPAPWVVSGPLCPFWRPFRLRFTDVPPVLVTKDRGA